MRYGRGVADLSRRAVLRFGLAAGLTGVILSGCALSDPTINRPGADRPAGQSASGGKSSPSSLPTPTAAQQGAEREWVLSRAAADLGQRKGVSRRQRLLLAELSAAHRSHADRLTGASGPTTTPSPTPSPTRTPSRGSVANDLKTLVRAEKAAAKSYRPQALDASGTQALLWSSLAVSSSNFAAALSASKPLRVAGLTSPQPVTVLSDIETAQAMVTQLHALIYGYQLAMGTLPESEPAHDRALTELQQYRAVRDVEITWLIQRSAQVPVAQPAYLPSVDPIDARSSATLISTMLLALQPFCGLAVAGAGSDQDRQQAFDLLEQTVARARGWGAPVSAWPGYTT